VPSRGLKARSTPLFRVCPLARGLPMANTRQGCSRGLQPESIGVINSPLFDGEPRSPLEAIRAFCLWCCGESAAEVRKCPATGCAFFSYRSGKITPATASSLLKAIEARCLDCKPDGAADCDASQAYKSHPSCPCWPYRMGESEPQAYKSRGK